MRKLSSFIIAFVAAITLFGCSTGGSFLPKLQQTSDIYWQSHKEAETAYSMIVPGKTTRLQYRAIGFDPKRIPNARNIDKPREIRDMLLGKNASTKVEDLSEGAQECLKAKDFCAVEVFVLGTTNRNEEGGFIANKTDWRVVTRTTGWSFNPTFFILKKSKDAESDDDVVIYKDKDDEPNINKVEKREDRFGPAKIILGPIRGFLGVFGVRF